MEDFHWGNACAARRKRLVCHLCLHLCQSSSLQCQLFIKVRKIQLYFRFSIYVRGIDFSMLFATFIAYPILPPTRVCACFGDSCIAIFLSMRMDECCRLFETIKILLWRRLHGDVAGDGGEIYTYKTSKLINLKPHGTPPRRPTTFATGHGLGLRSSRNYLFLRGNLSLLTCALARN
jgi:hypothetical protein